MKKTLTVLTIAVCCLQCHKVNDKEGGTKDGSISADAAGDFSIAIIPDTQYYTAELNGGNATMFTKQTDWIVDNRVAENIAYVIHLGDCTDHGDAAVIEWNRATNAMYRLESPVSIPYGIAVGNHDQSPNTGFPLTCTTNYYNQFFGVSHFSGRSYYGGHYGSNNDSHYDLFTAGGINFIVIYIEYDSHNQDAANMNTWAYNLLGTYSSRKAIVVTHYMMDNGNQGAFGPQGLAIYNRLKTRPNLFMLLGGHIAGNGEGQRLDTYNGKIVRTMLSDYQGRAGGGSGLMRLITVKPSQDVFSVRTFSPYNNTTETDADSDFDRPLFRMTRNCAFTQQGITDRSFYNNGVYKIYGQSNVTAGQPGDIPVPADYDGDGKTEAAVWRPSTGDWIINGVVTNYGLPGDIPVPADYTGDGKAELAIWRPSNHTWYIRGVGNTDYGIPGDIPVPGDYNGDGKADKTLWRPSNGFWYVFGVGSTEYGSNGDIPVPGDYNGDGITDKAVWRPTDGRWYRLGSSIVYGQSGDIPVPGDYNGDGITDPAVWRPSNNTWHTLGGSVSYGSSGDQPVPLPYSIRNVFFP